MIEGAIATVTGLVTNPGQVRADTADRTEFITDLIARTMRAVYAAGHEAGRGEADPTEGVYLTRDQLAGWAGRELDDDDMYRLGEAIGNSSIPEAIGAIVASFDPDGLATGSAGTG